MGMIYGLAYSFVNQMLVSTCQLYGDVLYFYTEFNEGGIHSQLYHPLHFWFYFIFLNVIWIVVPIILIVESSRAMAQSQGYADNKTKKKRT